MTRRLQDADEVVEEGTWQVIFRFASCKSGRVKFVGQSALKNIEECSTCLEKFLTYDFDVGSYPDTFTNDYQLKSIVEETDIEDDIYKLH